jgi:ornithine carbamoyltransferase
MARHFLSLKEYSEKELRQLLRLSADLKSLYRSGDSDDCLSRKTVVMLFEKPSSRTRISFEVAATQLGGHSIYIRPEDIGGLGQREPVKDLARVLNGYADVIVARTFSHDSILELAHYSSSPVINALSDFSHPCQAMADMLTIQEHCGDLEQVKVAYIGDGNNVALSLAMACAKLGAAFATATPAAYAICDSLLKEIRSGGNSNITTTTDPFEAVKDADVIYTDTWVSMGQEADKQQRMKDFAGYTVNSALVKAAKPQARIMHCLPAYRDLEITDEVLESPNSIIFDQAENRLHFQRALIKYLLKQPD